jgi:hypothetical protein
MNDALYLTLQVFGKSLGVKQVVEICQRFILDSIPSEPIVESVPVPVTASVPVPVTAQAPVQLQSQSKKLMIIKTLIESESPKIVLPAVKSAKKITPVNTNTLNRNFKKMAQETHFLPVGTILITSETDTNPAIFATITRTPLGAPAIQPSWDKTKFFTGTLTPPVMFLKEATKHFKIMSSKPVDTSNAWNNVYKRNTDGSNISLADLWKQTVA